MKTKTPIFSTDKNQTQTSRRRRIGELSLEMRDELNKLSTNERKELIRDAKFTLALLRLNSK